MRVDVNRARLEAFLAACEDAEALGGGEYTVDLYDLEPPVSMDIQLDDKGVDVLAERGAGRIAIPSGRFMSANRPDFHQCSASKRGICQRAVHLPDCRTRLLRERNARQTKVENQMISNTRAGEAHGGSKERAAPLD